MDDLDHQISKIIDKIQIPFNQVTEVKTETKPANTPVQVKMNEKRTNVTC